MQAEGETLLWKKCSNLQEQLKYQVAHKNKITKDYVDLIENGADISKKYITNLKLRSNFKKTMFKTQLAALKSENTVLKT